MQTDFESSLSVAQDNFHRQLELLKAEQASQQIATAMAPQSPEPLQIDSPLYSPLAMTVFTPKYRVAERFGESLGGLTPVVRPVSEVESNIGMTHVTGCNVMLAGELGGGAGEYAGEDVAPASRGYHPQLQQARPHAHSWLRGRGPQTTALLAVAGCHRGAGQTHT
jgi:hypothetical protein